VEFTDQFHDWWLTLDEEQQEALAGRVRLLQARGPSLGRPSVDTIASSRHQHMKEIRCAKHGTLRVLFAFDPDDDSDFVDRWRQVRERPDDADLERLVCEVCAGSGRFV
jgi:hypothetical protein